MSSNYDAASVNLKARRATRCSAPVGAPLWHAFDLADRTVADWRAEYGLLAL
jgi:hypothetical protein